MIRIFIGYDPAESIAYHVLAQSIMDNASVPVSITPLHRGTLRAFYTRERGPLDSTEFSISRFMVPFLSDFMGWSVFMDCDMLVRGDVVELANYMTLATRWTQSVQVVKHEYTPALETKFLGAQQTKYRRKNWSSVMIFNNPLCRSLTPEYVNNASGLDLHQFKWCSDDAIGRIPKEWNYLVGEDGQVDPRTARLVHFTNGTPCFKEYANCEFADDWRAVRDRVIATHQLAP